MILLPCPWCGPRDAAEFGYLGEIARRPDPGATSAQEWRGYLWLRANRAGWTRERWYHRMGCRRHLTLARHTVSNEVRPDGEAAPVDEP